MTVDWFLMDAHEEVPEEFATWQAATARRNRLFARLLDLPSESEVFTALERAAHRAKSDAKRLESAARAAWKRRM